MLVEKELLDLYIAKLERIRAGTDLTAEMVSRSREQIAISWDLLKSAEAPKVWHPDPK